MRADLYPAAGLPRLCFVSYRQIRQMAMPIIAEYRDRADIEVVDGSFDVALDLARERLERGQVDAFVSAGSNASLLRRGLLDNGYHELPVGSEHAVAIDSLPPHHKDPFDRLLVAQARVEGITLLTTDAAVAQYPGPVRKV